MNGWNKVAVYSIISEVKQRGGEGGGGFYPVSGLETPIIAPVAFGCGSNTDCRQLQRPLSALPESQLAVGRSAARDAGVAIPAPSTRAETVPPAQKAGTVNRNRWCRRECSSGIALSEVDF